MFGVNESQEPKLAVEARSDQSYLPGDCASLRQRVYVVICMATGNRL